MANIHPSQPAFAHVSCVFRGLIVAPNVELASAFGIVHPVNGAAILLPPYKREDLTRMPSTLVLSSRIEPTNAQLRL